MIRALWFIAGLLCCAPSWAVDYWWDNAGTGDGLSVGSPKAWTPAAASAVVSRGNRFFLCGPIITPSVWQPPGIPGASGVLLVSGEAALSGCAAGGFDMRNAGGMPIDMGGGGRNFVYFSKFFIRNATSNCMQIGGNDNTIDGLAIDGCGDSGINVIAAAARLTIINSRIENFGNDSATAEAGINIQPRDAVAVSTVVTNGNVIVGNGVARYGIGFYPAGTGGSPLNNGTISGITVRGNKFFGAFFASPFNASRAATNGIVEDNDFAGVTFAGGVVVHTGGQGNIETSCHSLTQNWIIRDNIGIHNAGFNSLNAADAAGILIDECSSDILVARNESYENALSSFYTNDATNVTFTSNVGWGNGHNCAHFHGINTNVRFEHNDCVHSGTGALNFSGSPIDNGADGIQIDATSVSVDATNNIVRGSSSNKGIDADMAATGAKNSILGFTTTTEGGSFTGTVALDPGWIGGANPKTKQGFRIPSTSLVKCAGAKLAPRSDLFDRGMEPNCTPIGATIYGANDDRVTPLTTRATPLSPAP